MNSPSESPRFSMQAILRQTTELPSIPVAALRVVRLTDGSDATAKSVAEAISLDQSLAARVLRLANSAFFGLPRQVKSIQDAVVLLGYRTVRNIALVAGTYKWMKEPLPGYELQPKDLLHHSMAVAVGGQMIAKKSGGDPDSTFIAGLLADIGKFALSQIIDGKISLLVSLGLQAGMTFNEVEKKVIGHTHGDVSAHLCEHWNLPEEIVTGIRYHHNPSDSVKPTAIGDCIHIGDFLAMSVGCGIGGDGLLYQFDDEALRRRGLSAEDLDALIDEFVIAYERCEAIFEELHEK
ncbi:MAG: HDOD domain-containing protein [Armatimonadetes bacterium]|nr:HDOD domain-containing protein [Armatimonadota bacterium]